MLHQKISWDVAARAQCSAEYIGALSRAAQMALEDVLVMSRQAKDGGEAIPSVHLTQTLLHLLDEQMLQLNGCLETLAVTAIVA